MENSGHRGHHGYGHLVEGLLGGIIRRHRTHGDSHSNLPLMTSQHTSLATQHLLQKRAQGDLVERVHRYPLPRPFISTF